MKVPSEELLMHELEQESQEKKMCVISKNGLTLGGYQISWMVIVLVVAALFFYLHKQGALGESASTVFEQTAPRVVEPPMLPQSLSGGSLRAFNKPGQVRMMFGH
jgi:hypothetical protein